MLDKIFFLTEIIAYIAIVLGSFVALARFIGAVGYYNDKVLQLQDKVNGITRTYPLGPPICLIASAIAYLWVTA